MKNFLFILFIFMVSCSKSNDSKDPLFTGIYKNEKPTWIENKLYKTHSYVMGSTLALSKDSTFIYKTCGIFMTGSWKKEKDSLYLQVKNHKYFLDSLNSIKQGPPSEDFFVYHISEDGLIAKMKDIIKPEKKVLNKLVKE